MINELNRRQGQLQMNEYGKKRVPFFFAIDYKAENIIVHPLDEIGDSIHYYCRGETNLIKEIPSTETFIFEKQVMPYTEYLKGYEIVQEALKCESISFINYTQATPIQSNLNTKEIFVRSRARYKLWIENRFVCFSPETFIRIQNGLVSCFPMKGTIGASIPNAESSILLNEKEISEHIQCVNLVSSDLKKVATNIRLDRFRYIERIQCKQNELLQVSSIISGDLPADFTNSLGDILLDLLPAGSIIGTPKQECVHLLDRAESHTRAYYTGVFGVFDGENLDSGVLIRFIEDTPQGLVFKSGGGITLDSKPEQEYQEMVDKVYVPIY